MMTRTSVLTAAALTLAAFTGASTPDPASVSFTSFTGDGVIPGLSITVDDHTNAGDLTFAIEVDTTQGFIADILGLYFDVTDTNLLTGMSVISGTDVTASDFTGNVSSLGGGNNMNGSGGAPWHAGVQFGENGIGVGKGDYQLVNVVIGAADDLTIGDLARVGLRLQSVGELQGNRGGSSKLIAGTPDDNVIPTPAAAGLGLAMLGLASLRRRGR